MDEETEAQQSAQEHLKWQPGKAHNSYATCLKSGCCHFDSSCVEFCGDTLRKRSRRLSTNILQ